MVDLIIIHPGAAREIYGELANEFAAIEPPLWARLIAGYIRDRGFTVSIFDADAERVTPQQIAHMLMLHVPRPRLICISAMGQQPSASTQAMVGAGAVAKAVKKLHPTIPIIMVGGHVAALPERTLREEAVDYACNGEGPATVLGLLRHDPVFEIPGLVAFVEPNIIYNGPPAPLLDMKDLHGNVWDLLPMEKYRAHNWQCFGDLSKRQPYASIMTSLGCSFACNFCCIQAPFSPEINGRRYRMRDPGEVVAEIKMLHEKYAVCTFKFVDEMWLLNRRHVTAICEGLIAEGLGEKLNMWAYSRIDTTGAAELSLLRRAGIRWLALGIESGSKHVRDGAAKALRNDDIIGVVRQIQAAGIHVIGNFIIGLTDDDSESMQSTLDLALACNCEFTNWYSAMAYPGSKLYTDAIANGSNLPASWSGYSQHSFDCTPLATEHVSAAEVLRFRDNAFMTYFQNPAYLSMIESKFGQATVAHIREMTSHKLKRKLLGDVS